LEGFRATASKPTHSVPWMRIRPARTLRIRSQPIRTRAQTRSSSLWANLVSFAWNSSPCLWWISMQPTSA